MLWAGVFDGTNFTATSALALHAELLIVVEHVVAVSAIAQVDPTSAAETRNVIVQLLPDPGAVTALQLSVFALPAGTALDT